jgi:predicted phage baseplate assembly protein
MALTPPILDDRSFDELVDELLRRIPAHTPEWTHPRVGDPGRTLIDLFAWLADTLLYRINLVPERQRLVFLELLGMPMRPAQAATGLVSITPVPEDVTAAVTIRPRALIKGPVTFESASELTVLPVTAEVFLKAALPPEREAEMAGVVSELMGLYGLSGRPRAYVTTPAFPGNKHVDTGVELGAATVDGDLWIALLAGPEADVGAVRTTLGGTPDGRPQTLRVAVVPTLAPTQALEEIGQRVAVPHQWELTTGATTAGAPPHVTLDVLSDGTAGLTRAGVVELALPAKELIGAPADDVRQSLHAGVGGDQPPRLDDPDKAGRVAAWLRLRTTAPASSLRLSWVGVNAVAVDQRQTMTGLVVGQSTGAADQVHRLPRPSVEPETFRLEVEEQGAGYRAWRQVSDLLAEGPDARAFTLDSEAGTVRFGDGMRGRIPEPGARIRVAVMRTGGGGQGNLPPGSLTEVTAHDLNGVPVIAPKLAVVQAVPTRGGTDPETLAEAERRIPAALRHRDRAVTADDFRALALETPGTRLGRAEVLPRFLPNQRRPDVPGVVSVMVLPFKAEPLPPNPRPDRALLGAVHAYLDLRRPLATELYVIGTEYVPLGLGVAVRVREGFGVEETLHGVRLALRSFLWPLPPGGPQQTGWVLGRSVQDRELEVIVAQVPGVRAVGGVRLFRQLGSGSWQRIAGATVSAAAELRLEDWQLPELLAVSVIDGDVPPDRLTSQAPAGDGDVVPVPVVPEVC